MKRPDKIPTLPQVEVTFTQDVSMATIAMKVADYCDADKPIAAIKLILDICPERISLRAAKWIVDRFRYEYVSAVEDGRDSYEAIDRLEWRLQGLQAVTSMPKMRDL